MESDGRPTNEQSAEPKPKRRRFQYSLRTLLIFVTLFAVACSWFAVKLQQARRQREAVDTLVKLGCTVRYDYEFDSIGNWKPNTQLPHPPWLCTLLGIDFFSNVIEVYTGKQSSDVVLAYLGDMSQIRTLICADAQLTDDGLKIIQKLNRLQELQVSGIRITDAGLENIQGLTRLEGLHLINVGITDAGLKHLTGLSRLQKLTIWYAKISDEGLVNLKGLHKLEILWLHDTNVTDNGIRELQKMLPNLKIRPR